MSLGSHLGVTWVSLGCHLGLRGLTLGHVGVTLGSFWIALAFRSYFEVTLVHFQKTAFFPMDFTGFMQLWVQLGVTLGALGAI